MPVDRSRTAGLPKRNTNASPWRNTGRRGANARPVPTPHPEENAILTAAPELAEYVAGLKQRSRKVITLALRQLLRLVREYPREPLLGAVQEAGQYGLYDLDRLERMILRRVTREYFLLEEPSEDDLRTGTTAEEPEAETHGNDL